ncbi:hypothetical protein CALVIDRAFT_480072 [Calocera viscosa TUFC12733]|uniref:CxC5 like cysteine cluster associated with KDZ domain-containing protein n=1 Tax=Calocera viscosa (strain TUFC12733) TaxID=1330018 RepID=A0A167N1M3_CALVF|nr:hypothetical protein CALVIDRAFT_480072 [Calocera viscosa TUFC12733]
MHKASTWVSSISSVFPAHAPDFSLGLENFYPPTRVCLRADCPRREKNGFPAALVFRTQYFAGLYTLGEGMVPVIVSSLRCRTCNTVYHLNFYREEDDQGRKTRTYYRGQPTVLQAEMHMLFEDRLCHLFRSQTVHAHSSATAIADIYNASLARTRAPSVGAYQPRPLGGPCVSDLFDLYSLLLHHCERGTHLRLPHQADSQYEHLKHAMLERNVFMAQNGQPHWAHACNQCAHTILRNGLPYVMTCAVTDGISIGRPCCRVHNCRMPLPHPNLDQICVVQGCDAPTREKAQTCEDPVHRAREEAYRSAGKEELERLEEEMQQLQLKEPPLGEPLLPESSHKLHGKQPGQGEAAKPTTKLRPHFGRRRTHNEQLVVRPCGVIVGRGTFYGAESLSSVVDFLRTVFPTVAAMPSVLFFDNNCSLRRYLADRPEAAHFVATALLVDVFHYKSKHSHEDIFCSTHCNLAGYPELFNAETGKWVFNSSACEQANAWLRKKQGQLREMSAIRFEFFLDEAIKARNELIVEELSRAGCRPHIRPSSSF